MKIFGDQPITKKEEDSLDRFNFAEHIAKGILNWRSEENLCIALHGPWGSGKTSIINLCIEAIKEKTKDFSEKEQPIIVQFRPWLISGQEQLIRSFLSCLRESLKKPNLSEHAHKAAQHLEIYEKLFSFVSWIPPVSEPAGKIRNFISKIKSMTQGLSKQANEDLEKNKDLICKELSKLSSPLIVIVDDVDRLTNQEIRQLFQLIKAVADFPNTIYLLAFDYLLVEKALEPFQSGADTRYLEKIVQLDFEIPNPSRSKIISLLWKGLEEIVNTISTERYEQDRWNEIKFGPLSTIFRNIRDVKRYLNAVNFMFPIIKGEVSSVDLLIVEAIHVFVPSLYKVIRNNKEYLISDSLGARVHTKQNKEKEEWIKKLPDLSPEFCRNEIKEMLSHLFPEVESVFEKHGWGNSFLDIWEKNQRICIASYFEHYFQGTLPEGEISAKEISEITKLFDNRNDLTPILKNYMLDGRIKKLLPKIEHYFEDKIEETKIQNFIISIFESGESLPLRPEVMFDIPVDWVINGTIYRLLKKLGLDRRKDVLINAMCSCKKAIVFPISIANYLWQERYPSNDKKTQKSDEEKLLSEEDTEEVKNIALELLRKYKDTEVLYKARHLISILHDWERWANIEEVRKWVKNILLDEKKIPEFLGGCGGFSGRVGMGSHYARYKFKINPDSLRRFCDVDDLRKKCERLLNSDAEWLTANYKEIIRAFLDGFQKKDLLDED
jgi:predicted KAP-like P-loop ATPase